MTTKGKLELTWVGKENRPRLEPRILEEDTTLSYGDPATENMLIHGDNLLALKALEQDFAGKIKCIYIDPPYNTGSAFTHYEDGLEHSIWLTMMRDRLLNLHALLSPSGCIFVQIDDREFAYLKVLMDEVFGRGNCLGTIVWQKRISPDSDSKFVSGTHDYILLYGKEQALCKFNRLVRTDTQNARYSNPDKDPRGAWTSSDLTRREYREHDYYPIQTPSGREVLPAAGRSWSVPKDSFDSLVSDNRIWFGPSGDSMPRRKRFLTEVQEGVVPTTWWSGDETGKNEDAKREIKQLFPGDPNLFATPKPEMLIQRIIHLGSDPGDWVLDSFAGSGTTGAVAHKMSRRWILVEFGQHCFTHVLPRLTKVIDGTDNGGATATAGWHGGGGFKFFRLAESLLIKDKDLSTSKRPVYIVNPKYDAKMLVRAICKIENYRYATKGYWHGFSSEHHFLYVTTKILTQRQLDILASQLGADQALLIYATRRSPRLNLPDNIEVKKIPRDLLTKCAFEETK